MTTIFTYTETTYRLLVLLVLLLLGAFNFSTAQTKHTVQVSSNVFTPGNLEIEVGDTVEWVNTEGIHNVNGTTDAYPDNPESFGNGTGAGWTFQHVFTIAGDYDYHCDPHVTQGMVGEIRVNEESDDGQNHMLVINFSGMDPHNNQILYLRVYEKDTGVEIERTTEDIGPSFSDTISGIEMGHSYYIDFFADHNGNGSYDAPPTDHAWRLELDNVAGDTTLNFAHNTNFTDIMWEHQLTVQFSGMTPHVGQMLELYVVNSSEGTIKDTVTIEQIAESSFEVASNSLTAGESYYVNFYADFNQNGSYDAPPTDHAWQLMLDNASGDTTLTFVHNTEFTDIFGVTSISDNQLGQFIVYPNPAKNSVWIESEETFFSDLEISVYDILGRQHEIESLNLSNRVKLNVSSMNSGIYMIELRNSDKRKILKLIKE